MKSSLANCKSDDEKKRLMKQHEDFEANLRNQLAS